MNTNQTNEPQTGQDQPIILRLYVAGMTRTARKAFANLEEICENHFPGKYNIEVLDLKKHPQLAMDDEVFAVPTVVRQLPPPLRKVIGDLSDSEEVLVGLELLSKE